MKTSVTILWLLVACAAVAQTNSPRIVSRINADWQFIKGDSAAAPSAWQSVKLPHTWNIDDVMDDTPGYYRGVGWYKKIITLTDQYRDKELSLYFEGANQVTEVFINGKKAGHHIGGYTGFSVSGTQLKPGKNVVMVKVDNSHNENIPPLSADFTFYGGIYRDVYLIATGKVHFTAANGSRNGVYLTTPVVSDDHAEINIRSIVVNKNDKDIAIRVTSKVMDAAGVTVAQTDTAADIASFVSKGIIQKITGFKSPKLWSPERPYLYTVETTITDAAGKVLDAVSNPLGFRWFSFDAGKGFFLNGAPYKLAGASRHQDYKGLGNAVPDELAVKDLVLLKKMGANFLRVAHYPQDPSVLEACDRLGLLAAVEIPIVNEITENEQFYVNCEKMQTEMIRQGFNHPSIIMWCYMNEVLLRPHFNDDKPKQEEYYVSVRKLAQRLEDLTRREDPYRYTMMAYHGNLNQYKNAGLLSIPMVIGWNLYSGWYGGAIQDFPAFLDAFHKNYPDRPFLVTEYGADADPRIRSAQPVRFDKSIEYATAFHQFYFTEMMKRPFVAGAVIWNLADFNSETRTETMPHINNKGLLQWDRTPKDLYHFYQAMLSKEPFIKILGPCSNKYGIADSVSAVSHQPVQIANNLDSVAVQLNGRIYATLRTKDGLCATSLPFRKGANTLIVKGYSNNKIYTDSAQIHVHLQPHNLANGPIPFQQMNILLGTSRYFVDEKGEWWQPDQVYYNGAWGSVGGKGFKLESNSRLPYGTDKNILGTNDDPIYQTQQTGIRQYRLNVPPGKYEVTLHFAELLGGKVRIPPYNLSDDERSEKIKRRIFNVRVNGKTLLQHFNIAQDYGLSKAVMKSTTVIIQDSQGLLIDFEPVEGEPVLNALQLKKLPH